MVEFIQQYYFLVFVICCLGHALIWVRAINWMHGIRSQALWTDLVRLVLHVILSGIPLWWFLINGFQAPDAFWESWPVPLNWLFTGFLWLIGLLGLFLFPVVWIRYLLRKEPEAHRFIKRDTFDVAQALGRKPAGTGRRAWKALLPGNQIFHVDLVERELVIPRLPAIWDGIRLLHISDLHFCGRPGRGYFERVFHYCAKRPFDLLILTGDLIDHKDFYHWLQLLQMLQPRLGKLAIRGNHDALYDGDKVNALLNEMGFITVGGKCETIALGDEHILVAGNEAPWIEPIPEVPQSEENNLFRLALIHSPDQFAWTVQNKFDLVLAGHNHGGQIRVPGFGSIFVPSKTGRQYDCGVFQQNETVMHVSRGLSGGHPVRYFCKPEVTWLTLKKEQFSASHPPTE